MRKWLRKTLLLALFVAFGIAVYLLVVRWQPVEVINENILAAVQRFFNGLFALYLISVGVVIFLENKDPSKTLAWLLVLIFLPVVGFVFYVLFGRNYKKRRRTLQKLATDNDRLAKAAAIQREIFSAMGVYSERGYVNERLVHLLLENASAPLTMNNDVEVLTNGDETYRRIFEVIGSAKHHIHLEYFIIRDDTIGQALKKRLIEKAREGIDVRLIYDSVGCWKLGKAYRRELSEAGVQLHAFFPVAFPVLSRDLNYRNHRKIVVVDGRYGFVGGLNIGDEYLGKSEHMGFWRDTHLMITGDGVYSLQSIFLNDWRFVAGENVDGLSYYPPQQFSGEMMVQIAASGPDSDWQSILQAYFSMISTAEDRLYIATPYLVPEESLLMALKTASLSGVDVRIIIPGKPDHFFVYWASRDHIAELLEAGIRIYTYEKGFIHAKMVLVDGSVASVGTANLDYRSLEINFEVNAFVHDREVTERLERDFINDLADSQEITKERHADRPFWHRVLEAVGRLVSPLQ